MPFLSRKQNSWAHTTEGTKALGGADKVKEWSDATDFKNLPEIKGPKNRLMGGAVRREKFKLNTD